MNPYELLPTHGIKDSKKYKKLKDDIKIKGILNLIYYVVHNEFKYIVDGHHRILAAKELRIDDIPAKEVALPYNGYKTPEDLINQDIRS